MSVRQTFVCDKCGRVIEEDGVYVTGTITPITKSNVFGVDLIDAREEGQHFHPQCFKNALGIGGMINRTPKGYNE